MRNKFKLGALVLSICMLILSMLGCGGSQTADNGQANTAEKKEPIKIGFMAPLTGNMMQYGVSFQNAINMKVEEINANGGIDGRKVEIVAFDDKGDPKEAVNIANKIVSDKDIKAVYGSFTSSCSMAAAPVFEEAGVLHFAGTASHPDFVFMGEKMFSIAMTMKFEGVADADYAYKKTGGKDMAVIYLNSDYGISHSTVFKDHYEAIGGKVVAFEQFIPGQTKDFTPIIAKVKQANPGALFVIADYSDGAQIFKQVENLDLKCDLIAPAMLIKAEFLDVVGSSAEGLLMLSTLPVYSEDDKKNENEAKAKFVTEYAEKYKAIPDGFPANAYDSISILANIIDEVGYDSDAMCEKLKNLGRYEGVSGNINISPETKEVKRDLMIYTIKDGKYVIDEVVPAK